MVSNISAHARADRGKVVYIIARGNNEEIQKKRCLQIYFNSKIFSGGTNPFEYMKSLAFLYVSLE